MKLLLPTLALLIITTTSAFAENLPDWSSGFAEAIDRIEPLFIEKGDAIFGSEFALNLDKSSALERLDTIRALRISYFICESQISNILDLEHIRFGSYLLASAEFYAILSLNSNVDKESLLSAIGYGEELLLEMMLLDQNVKNEICEKLYLHGLTMSGE